MLNRTASKNFITPRRLSHKALADPSKVLWRKGRKEKSLPIFPTLAFFASLREALFFRHDNPRFM
jgi:hypothetical protein